MVTRLVNLQDSSGNKNKGGTDHGDITFLDYNFLNSPGSMCELQSKKHNFSRFQYGGAVYTDLPTLEGGWGM